MSAIWRLFTRPVVSRSFGASALQGVLTSVGVFTFLAGAFYLPSLGPTRIEAIFALLLLGIFALMCTAVGQLTVILERLTAREKSAAPHTREDTVTPVASQN
jgi:hypothetical protein